MLDISPNSVITTSKSPQIFFSVITEMSLRQKWVYFQTFFPLKFYAQSCWVLKIVTHFPSYFILLKGSLLHIWIFLFTSLCGPLSDLLWHPQLFNLYPWAPSTATVSHTYFTLLNHTLMVAHFCPNNTRFTYYLSGDVIPGNNYNHRSEICYWWAA